MLGSEGKLRQEAQKVMRGSRWVGGGTDSQNMWLIVNQVEKASEEVGMGPEGVRERGGSKGLVG